MHMLLFIFYSVVLCYLLRRMRFFRDSGIRPSVLLPLFGLRVAAGCLHNWVAYRFYPNHGDIWAFFDVSFITRHELFHDWHQFMADNAFWAYLPYNMVIYLHIVFNFLSFDNMYINTLLFSFGVFAGSIALFRAFRGFFRDDLVSAFCALLLPSTLYWTACIHKEGLIYLSLGFFFYYLQTTLSRSNPTPATGKPHERPGWNIRSVFLCLLFFCLAAFFRPGIAIGLFMGLVLWCMLAPHPTHLPRASRFTYIRPLRIVFAVLLVALIKRLFTMPGLFTRMLAVVSTQQNAFQALHGHSRIYLPLLEPTAGSFLHALPTALINGFFQPWLGMGGQAIYLIFSIELIIIWIIVVYSLFSLPKSAPDSRGFMLCCLFFAFSGMLLIGYTVPFAGAIIRYRSLYLPFILAPFLHLLYRQHFYKRINSGLSRILLSAY